MIAGIGAIDWCMLAVLLVSVLAGAWRGLVFELMALAGWVVAYFAARWLAPAIAPHLPIGNPGSAANAGAAFVLGFLATLILWSLLARLVRLLLHATPLSLLDRLGGAAFGMLRGAVVLIAVATLVSYLPAAQSRAWQASVGAGWLEQAVRALKPALPGEVQRWLPNVSRS